MVSINSLVIHLFINALAGVSKMEVPLFFFPPRDEMLLFLTERKEKLKVSSISPPSLFTRSPDKKNKE